MVLSGCAVRSAIQDDNAEQIAAHVVLAVSEIADRNSPDDQPEMMLVTADELRRIVIEAIQSN